jgi:hypothetical protein
MRPTKHIAIGDRQHDVHRIDRYAGFHRRRPANGQLLLSPICGVRRLTRVLRRLQYHGKVTSHGQGLFPEHNVPVLTLFCEQ